jgi:hypothetical protein
MYNKVYTLILCAVLFSSSLFSSFPADTLITTCNAFSFIEALTVGQSVVCVDAQGAITFKKIIDRRMHAEAKYVHIILDGDEIITTLGQKFYVPQERIFKDAEHLKVGDCLLNIAGEYIEILEIVIVEEEQEKEFFDITVDECHNFFVSRSQVLVHNIGPLAVGLTWSFGAGAVEFAGATISACVAGICLGVKMYKERSDDPKNKNGKGGYGISFGGGAPFDPEEFKKHHPHGKYVGSPKHHDNVKGDVSRAPKDGQKALDQSISVSDRSSNRIGVSDGEIVELKMTRIGEYHGHVVQWKNLAEPKKGVLRQHGLVNHKGKIVL